MYSISKITKVEYAKRIRKNMLNHRFSGDRNSDQALFKTAKFPEEQLVNGQGRDICLGFARRVRYFSFVNHLAVFKQLKCRCLPKIPLTKMSVSEVLFLSRIQLSELGNDSGSDIRS